MNPRQLFTGSFGSVLRLELDKQRRNFISIVIIIGILFVVLPLVTVLSGFPWSEAFRGTSLFILLAEFLFICPYMGAVASASLRSDNDLNKDIVLPASYWDRVIGSYAANLLYTFVVLAVPTATWLGFQGNTPPSGLLGAFGTAWILPLGLYLNLLVFLLGYWIGKPILPAGIALIFTSFELVLTLVLTMMVRSSHLYYMYQEESPHTLALMKLSAPLVAGLFFIFAFAALLLAAPRLERRGKLGPAGSFQVVALLLAGLFLGPVAMMFSAAYGIQKQMDDLYMVGDTAGLGIWEMRNFDGNSLMRTSIPSGQGVLLCNISGDLVRWFKDGTKQILYDSDSVPTTMIIRLAFKEWDSSQLVFKGWQGSFEHDRFHRPAVMDLVSASDGNVWAVMGKGDETQPSEFVLLHAGVTGPLKPCTEFPRGKGYPYFYANADEVTLISTGRELFGEESCGCKFVDGQLDDYFSEQAGSGKVAVLLGRKVLRWHNDETGASMDWSLPGQATLYQNSGYVPLAWERNGVKTFVVITKIEGAEHLVFCSNDGQMTTDVAHAWLDRKPIPEGGTVFRSAEGWIAIQRTQGMFSPVDGFEARPALEREARFLRLFHSRLWYQTSDRVEEIDLETGKLANGFPLPNRKTAARYQYPSQDGIYYTEARHLYLLDWNGDSKTVADLR